MMANAPPADVDHPHFLMAWVLTLPAAIMLSASLTAAFSQMF